MKHTKKSLYFYKASPSRKFRYCYHLNFHVILWQITLGQLHTNSFSNADLPSESTESKVFFIPYYFKLFEESQKILFSAIFIKLDTLTVRHIQKMEKYLGWTRLFCSIKGKAYMETQRTVLPQATYKLPTNKVICSYMCISYTVGSIT